MFYARNAAVPPFEVRPTESYKEPEVAQPAG